MTTRLSTTQYFNQPKTDNGLRLKHEHVTVYVRPTYLVVYTGEAEWMEYYACVYRTCPVDRGTLDNPPYDMVYLGNLLCRPNAVITYLETHDET